MFRFFICMLHIGDGIEVSRLPKVCVQTITCKEYHYIK